jgi:site-specific recombinase XerD
MNKVKPTDFARSLSNYFFEYLPVQKGLSENTIKSYRDSMSVFLNYCEKERHLRREKLEIKNLDRSLIEDFLSWLEQEKCNSVATRNLRRIALNTFFKYLQYENPEYVLLCQHILSIPHKAGQKQTIRHLPVEAIEEILRQPDLKSRNGRRDFALLSLMYESAARISEIADLCVGDLHFERGGAIVHLRGKGKKFRDVPLIHDVSSLLKDYLSEEKSYRPCDKMEPLFCNRDKEKLTRAGISYIFNKYINATRSGMSDLLPAKVFPHIFRHSRAMHWLEAGMDLQYIKDLLGHADLSTTEVYAQLNTKMKRKILEEVHPKEHQSTQYPSWAEDKNLMSWLSNFQGTH